jgi:CheY-like chemotaxis protein
MESSHPFALWAEDDENDALLLRRALEKQSLGDLVLRVRDGEEVIEYLTGAGCYADRDSYPLPAVLLLDVKMPRKNGFDVLSWKQAQPGLRDMNAIMLTSSDDEGDRLAAYQLGATAYLVKPSFMADMVRVVQSLLEATTAAERCGERAPSASRVHLDDSSCQS